MIVTHCICYNLSLTKIVEMAKEKAISTVSGVRRELNVCNKCRLCNPYLRDLMGIDNTSSVCLNTTEEQ